MQIARDPGWVRDAWALARVSVQQATGVCAWSRRSHWTPRRKYEAAQLGTSPEHLSSVSLSGIAASGASLRATPNARGTMRTYVHPTSCAPLLCDAMVSTWCRSISMNPFGIAWCVGATSSHAASASCRPTSAACVHIVAVRVHVTVLLRHDAAQKRGRQAGAVGGADRVHPRQL